MKIGIIGVGSVGGAIAAVLREKPEVELVLVDVDSQRGADHPSKLMDCDCVYICVPTPSCRNGECDYRQLQGALLLLNYYGGLIISKSTAPPDVYRELHEEWPNLIYSPEFLTEARAENDYRTTRHIILGGSEEYLDMGERIVGVGLKNLESVHRCTIEEAALAKYAVNTFLATKVIFMNELHQLAQSTGCDWSRVRDLLTLDQRIGDSHTVVPGADGPGFAGKCFPKDAEAILSYARSIGVDLSVLRAAVEKNHLLRGI